MSSAATSRRNSRRFWRTARSGTCRPPQSPRPGPATDFRIELSDGGVLRADLTVIATGHPPPALPDGLRALIGSQRLIADPCDATAIAAIGPAEWVLIVGSGLTSADVVASLKHRGFWGEIVALSRHGLRSRGHAASSATCDADFTGPLPALALALLQCVRAEISAGTARGCSWQSVVDRVRKQGQALWQHLDGTERARVARHLRPYWDVHRFRVAPQIERVLDREVAAGRLAYIAARLLRATETADGVQVEYRPRGRTAVVVDQFDTVVVTTGPAHADVLRTNPALEALAEEGLVPRDPLEEGFSLRSIAVRSMELVCPPDRCSSPGRSHAVTSASW